MYMVEKQSMHLLFLSLSPFLNNYIYYDGENRKFAKDQHADCMFTNKVRLSCFRLK